MGFTFPKYATGSDDNQTCVTKVTVSFKDFRFIVQLTPLDIGGVRKEIVRAVESALNFQAQRYPIFCFMCFSTQEVEEAAQSLRNRHYKDLLVYNVRQVPTKHSILLRSDDIFWKLIPRYTECMNLLICTAF